MSNKLPEDKGELLSILEKALTEIQRMSDDWEGGKVNNGKIRLSFFFYSDLSNEKLNTLAWEFFDYERKKQLLEFSTHLKISALDEKFALQHARKYIELPEPINDANMEKVDDVGNILSNRGERKVQDLFKVLDDAEFSISSKEDHIFPRWMTPIIKRLPLPGWKKRSNFIIAKRIERFRKEFSTQLENMRKDEFEIFQTRPKELIQNDSSIQITTIPKQWVLSPWNPVALKAKGEPEYFRRIWLNPEVDIPFVLEALKRLEFIDEDEVWRIAEYRNPLGAIVALIEDRNHSFFLNIDRIEIERAFCQRFKIQQPKKGFKPENRPFHNAKEKMEIYLSKIG